MGAADNDLSFFLGASSLPAAAFWLFNPYTVAAAAIPDACRTDRREISEMDDLLYVYSRPKPRCVVKRIYNEYQRSPLVTGLLLWDACERSACAITVLRMPETELPCFTYQQDDHGQSATTHRLQPSNCALSSAITAAFSANSIITCDQLQ